MSTRVIIDTITGDRLKIDTCEHNHASLEALITETFFAPLMSAQEVSELQDAGVNVEGMREAIRNLAGDILARTIRPGNLEFLALKIA